MVKRFYDDTTSRAFQDIFWDGVEQDFEEFGKRLSGRFIGVLKRKGFYQTFVDHMKRGIQPGLYWADKMDLLARCIEQQIINSEGDFPEDIKHLAAKRIAVMKPPLPATPELFPPGDAPRA